MSEPSGSQAIDKKLEQIQMPSNLLTALKLLSSCLVRKFLDVPAPSQSTSWQDAFEPMTWFFSEEPTADITLMNISLPSKQLYDGYLSECGMKLVTKALVDIPAVIIAFTGALNTSHLKTLNLYVNPQLSDSFIATFLPLLTSPTYMSYT